VNILRAGDSKTQRLHSRNGSLSSSNGGFFENKKGSMDRSSIGTSPSVGFRGKQTLEQLCMYEIMIPNIRYKQQIEKDIYF